MTSHSVRRPTTVKPAPTIPVHLSVFKKPRRKRRPRVSVGRSARLIPDGGEDVGMRGAELSATRAHDYPAVVTPAAGNRIPAASVKKTHHGDGQDDAHDEARRRDTDDEPEPGPSWLFG